MMLPVDELFKKWGLAIGTNNIFLTRMFDYIVKTPAIKTLIFGISTIVSGVLSGAFIYEITLTGFLNWKFFYRTKSLYLIFSWLLMIYVYSHILYKKEVDVLRFKDDAYCKAYIRSQCLPAIAARYRYAVEIGNTSELKDITSEIKRIMK